MMKQMLTLVALFGFAGSALAQAAAPAPTDNKIAKAPAVQPTFGKGKAAKKAIKRIKKKKTLVPKAITASNPVPTATAVVPAAPAATTK
jgi:hypothetical protein